MTVSKLAARRGRPRLWAFGYADLARLLGCSEMAVRKLVQRGRLDPLDLAALFAEWRSRAARAQPRA